MNILFVKTDLHPLAQQKPFAEVGPSDVMRVSPDVFAKADIVEYRETHTPDSGPTQVWKNRWGYSNYTY
ncbi:hypothetical protein [Hymenobacter siberiensis]|uniref:hypothetical protein n=1 Tax=Hymenobacter siberiensis TaxID=2848396 RepID=UPI001C1E0431|nr:hypothetical protein [Hymenobacter siberiensis]